MKIIVMIRKRMNVAQSRQKANADQCQRPIEFAVGDKVFLKVSFLKGIVCTIERTSWVLNI